MSTVKRVFLYTVSIIALGIFASGVGMLLTLCFELLIKGEAWRNFAVVQLSMGMAMLIIGGVLWFLFWRAIQRQVSGEPAETGSGIRKLYMNLILGIAAITGLITFTVFLQWLMSGVPSDGFPSGDLARFLVAGCLWFYHWKVEEREGQPSLEAKILRRWYVYILAAFGLVSLSNGVIQMVNASSFHLPVWGTYTVQGGLWDKAIKVNLSWILVGGLTWWFHWFRVARDDYESTLRYVYLYILTIAGGAVAGLAALTTILYKLFSFAFEGAGVAGDRYFMFLGWTIPTILVAAAIWTYHQKVVQEETPRLSENRLSPRRVYLYLMSFIGLGAMLSGLVFLLGVLLDLLFDALSSSAVFASGWWSDQLSLCLSLLLVGVSIWYFYWRRVLRMTDEGGVPERGARSRRVFLYIVLGLMIIALLTTLVIIVYQVLNGILQGTFGADFLRTMVWSLSVLFVAVPVLVYHWRVLREDQNLGAEKLPRRKRVNLIAGEAAKDLIPRIEEKLGSRLRLLRYTGEAPEEIPTLSDEEIEAIVNDIGAAAGTGVILVVTGGRVMVLPYEEM